MTDVEKFIKENGIKRGPTKVAKGYGTYRAPKPGIKVPMPKYDPAMKHYSREEVPWLREQHERERKENEASGKIQETDVNREFDQVTTKTQTRHKKAI